MDLGETTGDDIADLTKAVAAITASLASIKQQSRAREVPAVLAPPGSRVERKLLGQRVVDLEEAQGRLVDAVEAVVELQREFVESHLKNAERYAQSVEVIGKASALAIRADRVGIALANGLKDRLPRKARKQVRSALRYRGHETI